MQYLRLRVSQFTLQQYGCSFAMDYILMGLIKSLTRTTASRDKGAISWNCVTAVPRDDIDRAMPILYCIYRIHGREMCTIFPRNIVCRVCHAAITMRTDNDRKVECFPSRNKIACI